MMLKQCIGFCTVVYMEKQRSEKMQTCREEERNHMMPEKLGQWQCLKSKLAASLAKITHDLRKRERGLGI